MSMRSSFLILLAVVVLFPLTALGQGDYSDLLLKRLSMPFISPLTATAPAKEWKIPGKKVSQYTADDWAEWIDSTWGPGQGAEAQQEIFDGFWDAVDKHWAGFPNLSLDWDSVRAQYRPQIGSGLSRGRFFALMSRIQLSLMEWHTVLIDMTVDTTFGGLYFDLKWHYKSGVPLLCTGTMWWDLLGAPVTALPDSTGLVYRAVEDNPLGLEPGDLVLGYEGVPWKRLYFQLLQSGVPISTYFSFRGSTPAAQSHLALSSVGWNWGMFDTIDVVKYSTGDTLHLPTASLATLSTTVYATDQVPIAGVAMPEWPRGVGPSVSWGVVAGTQIGYIYVWDWWSPNTSQLFRDAVIDLRYNQNVKGLIIDFRMNYGGYFDYPNQGFAYLFGADPTSNYSVAQRTSPDDQMVFALSPPIWGFSPAATVFDNPIAVLIGPGCVSAGEHNAFRLRFHPMTRFFGKPTNGGVVVDPPVSGTTSPGWFSQIHTTTMYSNVPGEGFLIHKGVQPDEEVWLTRDGVARGEDDVVKRALEWISSLSYAHDVTISEPGFVAGPAVDGTLYAASDTLYSLDIQSGRATRIGWIGPDPVHGLAIKPSTVPGNTLGELYGVSTTSENTVLYRVSGSTAGRVGSKGPADSLRITAVVENPGTHTLVVSAIITNAEDSVVDSVVLHGSAGDSLWSAYIRTPSAQGRYGVSVRTDDMTVGSFRRLDNVARFTIDQTNLECIIPIPHMRAMAFDRDGTLFGATLNGRLYRIGPSAADTFYIGTAAGVPYSSLAFHPLTGELWASVRPALSGRDRIYKVDVLTGAAVLVGTTGGGRITPAIAFGPGPNSILYGLKSGSVSDTLITISTDNATATAVGLTGVTGLGAMAMLGTIVGVDEYYAARPPLRFTLDQNYPNPFNPATKIRYTIADRRLTRVSVYDLLGREVATLVNEVKDPGTYEVVFDASGLASGVYLYRLVAGSFANVRRMAVVR